MERRGDRVADRDRRRRLGIPTPDGWTDDGGRFLAATCGPMRVATIYVPNGRVVDSEFYLEKLEEWLARLSVWLNDNDPSTELAICGDFNVAPADEDVWDALAVHGGTHVSPRERAAVAKLRDWGMVDVVRQFHPEPGFFSWWDYRAGHFHKNFGMRIDHIYLSPPLAARAIAAERDREARKPSTYPGIPLRPRPADRGLRATHEHSSRGPYLIVDGAAAAIDWYRRSSARPR